MAIRSISCISSGLRAWIIVALLLAPATSLWTLGTPSHRYISSLNSAVDSQPQQYAHTTTPNSPSFKIRNCKYADLGVVADIILASFYQTSTSPFKNLYRLAELNRLQQNFPYNDLDRHIMLVATLTDSNEIVAFCDVDARPATRPIDPPRPYLSDLAVRPDCRRRGIAKKMVQECERTAHYDMNRHELYIRVEEKNTAAVDMYDGLGYEPLEHHIFGVQDTTVLLRKDLSKNEPFVLDYVV